MIESPSGGEHRSLLGVLVGSVALFAVSVAVAVTLAGEAPGWLEGGAWAAASCALAATVLGGGGIVPCVRRLRRAVRIGRSETWMQRVVEEGPDGVVTLGDDGRVEAMNPAACGLFRVAAPDLVGTRFADRIAASAPKPDGEGQALADALAPGPAREAVGLRPDGSSFPLELIVIAIAGDGRRRRVAFLRDISERTARERTLLHHATHDELTGLPNRYLLTRRFEGALKNAGVASPLAFLLVDLDRFKEVNDTLGHTIGDRLLGEIAERLKGTLRTGDTIARLGGDEFGVLLPDADLSTAVRASRALVSCLEAPFEMQGLSLHVEASVGITLYPMHGRTPGELIQRADVAMYVAKEEKIGVAVYQAERDFNSVRNLTLRGELQRAIENDELLLHYQPKVSAASRRIVGVEALVRWHHPQQGWLPPDQFIGAAEHSGLIRPLTRWVLGAAIEQCVRWRQAGLDISMALNLSARNLREEDLPQTVASLLEAHGLAPRHLIVEITEGSLMEDPARSMEVTTRLADLGVAIAIDDFGTGYSSLAYLQKLPARELKVDRSFVQRMDQNDGDAIIVQSTIEMAHNLGLKVVAEGVETRSVWIRLAAMGCDTVQGFFACKPMPADRLTPWLEGTDSESWVRRRIDAQVRSSTGP